MSFRRKTKPVVSISSAVRSRKSIVNEIDKAKVENDEKPPQNNEENNVTPCDQAKEIPNMKEDITKRDFCEIKEERRTSMSPEKGGKSQGTAKGKSHESYEGTGASIKGRRFRRFKPSSDILSTPRTKQPTLTKTEETVSSSVLDVDGPSYDEEPDKQNIDRDVKCNYPATCNEKKWGWRSTGTETGSNEYQKGFIVTESSISDLEPSVQKGEEGKAISEEKESDRSEIAAAESLIDVNDEKIKISTPIGRSRKRKIVPCLTRAGRKSDSITDVKPRQKTPVKEDINSRCSSSDIVKTDTENVMNKSLPIDTEVDSKCIMRAESGSEISTSGETNLCVDNNKKEMDNFEAVKLEPFVTSNEMQSNKKSNKKPKHVRFKPNIARKDTSPNGSTSVLDETTDQESDASFEKVNDEMSHQISVKSSIDHNQKGLHDKEPANNDSLSIGYGKNLSDVERCPVGRENVKGVDSHDSQYYTPHSTPYSDTEGSQSEGEGIQHYNKRKFTPCLGPKVRQRRRLSSLTVSEDDGHLSDKNQTDSVAENISGDGAVTSLEPNDSTADNGLPVKKQKRRRIIIKEPKKKMTMFDYIYYNPRDPDATQNEEREEKKSQKRSLERPTETTVSEIVLGAINGEESNSCSSVGTHQGSSLDNDREQSDDEVIAPQIKIGKDGQIVIDEESLVLKTTRSKMSLEMSEIVYTDDFDPYQRKQGPRRKKRWTIEETLKFYRVLSRIGTDFTFMMKFFPECPRSSLKKKFKSEEKFNGDLIDRALKNMLPMDNALIEELKHATELNKSRKTSTASTPNIASVIARTPQSKRGTTLSLSTSENLIQNPLSREEAIVQEEISTMEVAENITI